MKATLAATLITPLAPPRHDAPMVGEALEGSFVDAKVNHLLGVDEIAGLLQRSRGPRKVPRRNGCCRCCQQRPGSHAQLREGSSTKTDTLKKKKKKKKKKKNKKKKKKKKNKKKKKKKRHHHHQHADKTSKCTGTEKRTVAE